jgi:hypothetical protein
VDLQLLSVGAALVVIKVQVQVHKVDQVFSQQLLAQVEVLVLVMMAERDYQEQVDLAAEQEII